ncbi:MAG: hypothetical protein V4850_28965 [Myxococcota bacterium]
MLLLLPSLANAQDTLSLATLEAWRDELRAPIEAVAGRTFVEVPGLAIATPDTMALREKQLYEVGFRAARRDALAFYEHDTQGVMVQAAAWQAAFREHRVEATLLGPVVRCVLAHEMVHALQHQYAPTAHLEGDAAAVAHALAEGHADHVATQVCGEGRAWLDVIQGLDVLASRPHTDAIAMNYGYAEGFVRHLESVAGTDAVWAALSAPPPRELVVRVGAADLAPGWQALTPLLEAALPMGGPTGTPVGGRLSPAGALARAAPKDQEDAPDLFPLLPASAGLGWSASVGAHQNGVMAFLLESEADGRAWLARRRASLARHAFAAFLQSSVTMENPPRLRGAQDLRRLPGVDRTLAFTLAVGGDWAYHEAWALQGRRLLGAFTHDARPDMGAVQATVAALVALELPERGPGVTPADTEALAALAPAAPLPRTRSWEFSAAQLFPAIQRGEWAACVTRSEAALTDLPPAARAGVVAGAIPCAALADDLPAADRLVAAAGGVDTLPAWSGFHYAILLADVGRWEDALRALAADHPPYMPLRAWSVTADGAQKAASITLLASVHLARWDEVDRALAAAAAAPEDLAWAREQREAARARPRR